MTKPEKSQMVTTWRCSIVRLNDEQYDLAYVSMYSIMDLVVPHAAKI